MVPLQNKSEQLSRPSQLASFPSPQTSGAFGWVAARASLQSPQWPRGRYGPTTRKPIGEVVHLDRYGNKPYAE